MWFPRILETKQNKTKQGTAQPPSRSISSHKYMDQILTWKQDTHMGKLSSTKQRFLRRPTQSWTPTMPNMKKTKKQSSSTLPSMGSVSSRRVTRMRIPERRSGKGKQVTQVMLLFNLAKVGIHPHFFFFQRSPIMDIWRFNKLILLDYFQQDVQVVIFFPTLC